MKKVTNEKILKINKFLHDKLIEMGKDCVKPPEANQWLAQAELLSDSGSKPGLPLRKLLRKGEIQNAIQPGGYHSPWYILRTKVKHTPMKKR